MQNNVELNLNDISENLLILNKITVDKLFSLDSCTECVSLYVFYYKTAKWQKTNVIKANDTYIKKSLKWGTDKITRIKNRLKEAGLINVVQRRKEGKIDGWYIEVCYLVSEKTKDDIKIKVENIEKSKNTCIQEIDFTTSCSEETNALKEYIKCLENKIEMLENNKEENKKEKNKLDKEYFEDIELNDLFIEFLQMRKKVKAVNSERAINTLINKLNKYSLEEQKQMIENSLVNSWKDVYELKKNNNGRQRMTKEEEDEMWKRVEEKFKDED